MVGGETFAPPAADHERYVHRLQLIEKRQRLLGADRTLLQQFIKFNRTIHPSSLHFVSGYHLSD